MQELKGQLLISGGGLYDPNFRHTVVLIASHDETGAVGVILNRPLQLTVADAAPPLAALAGVGARLFEGGPVGSDQAVLLVAVADASQLDVAVLENIGFLTGDVSEAAAHGIHRARVFLGYAGWGPGQLEAELETVTWILEPARPEDVFNDEPATLWRRVLERKGPPFSTLARVPFDPSVN